MHYISPEQRERSAHFDQLIEDTTAAIELPGVAEKFDELGVDMATRLASAYLPNVSHGVISVPAEYVGVEGTAVLPALAQDIADGLTADSSMIGISAVVAQEVEAAFNEHTHPMHDARDILRQATMMFAESSQGKPLPLTDRMYGLTNYSIAPFRTECAPDLECPGSPRLMIRRDPFIVMGMTAIQSQEIDPRTWATSIFAHEIVHDADTDTVVAEDVDLIRARTELRAYSGSFHVLRTLVPEEDQLRLLSGVSDSAVEIARLAEADPGAPYEPNPRLVALLRTRGLILE